MHPSAPKFLGHLADGGNVVNFLFQKVVRKSTCVDDLSICEVHLYRLRRLLLVHGDVDGSSAEWLSWTLDMLANFTRLAKAEFAFIALYQIEETDGGGAFVTPP
ncbi:hypothetical protein J3E69DRAFT_314747 [Trichoderma sp. SZMC 28015]